MASRTIRPLTAFAFRDAEREAAERAIAPDPPNMHGTLLATELKHKAEVNLKALDVMEPGGKTRQV